MTCLLDILVLAGHVLRTNPTIDDALAKITRSLVNSFCDYSCIEVTIDGADPYNCRVTAGTPVDARSTASATLIEPLTDGHQTLGRLTCATSNSDRFNDDVRQAVRALALHLGIALASQVAASRERCAAHRLQCALLPQWLPVVRGAELHAAYRPPSEDRDGGDWFDAFNLPDRRVAISIGDVAGRGVEAAIMMGEVRQAIRTAAIAESSPATVLESVNRMLASRDSIPMVTAIFGVYDPKLSTLSYAAAGHPSPLLALSDGLVRRLPVDGLPLKSAPTLECSEWTFTLPAGGHAIFYTDGLIKTELEPVDGETQLLESVRALLCGPSDGVPADPALALQEQIFTRTSTRDDATVLILSRTAPVADYVFSAVPIVAPIARAIVQREIASLDIDEERRFGMLVALGEAVANAIEHAYSGVNPGLIRFEIENEARQLVMTVEDFGKWRPFIRREERGRGIELMAAFMDSVQIVSTHESTKIVLKAKLAL